MAKNNLDWNLYRSFLAVIQEGSLSGAGRMLGISQPSVGRHIEALEAAVGAPLFIRAQDGLRPTPLAQTLHGSAQSMAGAAQQAERIASGYRHQPRGTVRITASQIVGGEVLPELLQPFMAQHPEIAIELVLNNRNDDLLKGDADIAVRMARPTQQSLVSKRLGQVDIGLFAHKRYIRSRGLPTQLADLANHVLIGPDQDPFVAQMARQHRMVLGRDMFSFRSDNDLAQLAAMRAGVGIAGCHLAIGRKQPDLVEVLPGQVHFSLGMWLVMHVDQKRNPVIKLLYPYLAGALTAYARSSVRS